MRNSAANVLYTPSHSISQSNLNDKKFVHKFANLAYKNAKKSRKKASKQGKSRIPKYAYRSWEDDVTITPAAAAARKAEDRRSYERVLLDKYGTTNPTMQQMYPGYKPRPRTVGRWSKQSRPKRSKPKRSRPKRSRPKVSRPKRSKRAKPKSSKRSRPKRSKRAKPKSSKRSKRAKPKSSKRSKPKRSKRAKSKRSKKSQRDPKLGIWFRKSKLNK